MKTTLSERMRLALAGPPKKTQAALAKACKISPPSVNGWVTGETKTIEGKNLMTAADFLGVSPVWLATGRGAMRPGASADEAGANEKDRAHKLSVADRSEVELSIPLLAVKGSMGSGKDLTYEGDQIIDMMPLSRDWIRRNIKAPPEALRIITGAGDSMHPTFRDGDLLLVDTSKTNVDVDGVYVLSAHDRLFIKRVRQRISGEFEISSDNESIKTVDVLNGNVQVTVHGRVVWAWNGKSL